MISISKTVWYDDEGRACVISTYYGLSSDTKPTEGVGNGSSFVEMNTGKLYFFDAAGSNWIEWGGSSSTGSGDDGNLHPSEPRD